jgi:5-methyltetrahydropteroyltriglutamate--homocysteine methyltransferase
MSDMAEAVDGFVPERVPNVWHGPAGEAEVQGSHARVVASKLRQKQRLAAHEAAFLTQHSPGPFKVTLPSPTAFVVSSYRPGLTDRVYPTREDLIQDLVPIVRGEIAALIADGVPYVQLDAPQYTYYLDPEVRGRLGLDLERSLDEAVSGDQACLQGLDRDGVTIGMHICRGNDRGRWIAQGGYDAIAERVFGALPVDAFLLEFDSERAGGFEPLRFVRPTSRVVLGLITSKEPRLESQDLVLRRVEEAARYVPLDRLALSPQCGFASTLDGNPLSQDDQRRKLELVVDTARKIWG